MSMILLLLFCVALGMTMGSVFATEEFAEAATADPDDEDDEAGDTEPEVPGGLVAAGPDGPEQVLQAEPRRLLPVSVSLVTGGVSGLLAGIVTVSVLAGAGLLAWILGSVAAGFFAAVVLSALSFLAAGTQLRDPDEGPSALERLATTGWPATGGADSGSDRMDTDPGSGTADDLGDDGGFYDRRYGGLEDWSR